MVKKKSASLCIVFGLIALGAFSGATPAKAQTLDSFGALTTGKLPDKEAGVFSQNNLTFWNPAECTPRGGSSGGSVSSNSCFKINSSVDPSEAWYAEGCLDNGTCTGGVYASTAYTSGTGADNDSLLGDTGTDDDFGGMQYIYAENYDIEYDGIDGWIPKFTKKSDANSTRKYYWIVLPSEAYSNGFGETFVATFEKLSEPVYFITYDTHACEHQSENYCGQANADPNAVEAGKEFFGAITKNAGSPTDVANIVGKLTSLCRINGRGEVTVASNGDASKITEASGEASSSPSSESTTPSSAPESSPSTSGNTVAEKIWNWFAKANIPGLSDNPAAIAGIIGAFATEAGGNTIDGLTPFSWSSWGGTLLGCIPAYCGDIKSKVTEAVGHDYFAYSTGVDGIPEEAVDKAIDLELKFMMNDYNSGISWKTFIENLDVVSNKTPESYAELFEVIVQNAADASGDAVQDEGIINWVSNHSGYSTVQQVLSKKRELAREAYEKLADGDCTSYEGTYPEYPQHTDHTCGPASMAMLATVAAGQDITEEDVISTVGGDDWAYVNSAYGDGLDQKVADKYGFKATPETYSSKSDAYDKIKKYLNDGYMIHLSGEGAYPGFSNIYTDGHYIGLFSINSEDKVQVANSNSVGNSETDLQNIIDAIHNGGFMVIEKKSGNSGKCISDGNNNPFCKDPGSGGSGGSGGGTISTGGLSEAQAEKLSQYYNDGGGTSAGNLTDRMNCFAFSMWWITNFTDIIPEGENPTAGAGVATGDQLAGWLAENYDLPSGDYDAPKPYAIFSTTAGGVMNGTIHTGVVTAVHDDGTIDFVDAWFPNSDGTGGKMASVYTNITPIPPTTYVYLDGHVDMDKLKSVVGG